MTHLSGTVTVVAGFGGYRGRETKDVVPASCLVTRATTDFISAYYAYYILYATRLHYFIRLLNNMLLLHYAACRDDPSAARARVARGAVAVAARRVVPGDGPAAWGAASRTGPSCIPRSHIAWQWPSCDHV